jgi:hypothetical protein
MSREKKDLLDSVAMAAMKIRQRCPDDWALLVGYIRKQAYPVRVDAECVELVKAEYHRKTMAVQLLRKFNEIDEGE